MAFVQYPMMLTGTDPTTGKTTNLAYPNGHVKQRVIVQFNNATDQTNYDGTGVPISGLPGILENRHHT